MKERSKYQRMLAKKNQEYKSLADEVSITCFWIELVADCVKKVKISPGPVDKTYLFP